MRPVQKRCCAFWILLFQSVQAFSADAPSQISPSLPSEYAEFLKMDQNYNVPGRELMSDEQKAVVPVYHFDIPEEEIKTFRSVFLNKEETNLVSLMKDGKKFVRLFVVKKEGMPFEDLVEIFGKPQQTYWATRVQSLNTYFVWNPEKKIEPPIFMKMQLSIGKTIFNHAENAQMAVGISDIIEKSVRESKDPYFSMFPEHFGVAYSVGDFSYAYSIRSVQPLGVTHSNEIKLYPLHGFLSPLTSDIRSQIAAKMATDEHTWLLNEYLPNLARYMAVLQYKQGEYLEGHTQNIVIQIHNKTGRIIGFVAKDMTDVMIDPSVKLQAGKVEDVESVRALGGSLLNLQHVDEQTRQNQIQVNSAGGNMAGYAAQSVLSLRRETHAKELAPYLLKFLTSYFIEVQKVTGLKVPLSKKSKDLLEILKSGNLDSLRTIFSPNDCWIWEHAIIRDVVQNINDEITWEKMPKLAPEMLNYAQGTLRRIFQDLFYQKKVVLLFQDSKEQYKIHSTELGYAFDGKRILAFEKFSGRVIANAYALSATELKRIEYARVNSGNMEGLSMNCLKNSMTHLRP